MATLLDMRYNNGMVVAHRQQDSKLYGPYMGTTR